MSEIFDSHRGETIRPRPLRSERPVSMSDLTQILEARAGRRRHNMQNFEILGD